MRHRRTRNGLRRLLRRLRAVPLQARLALGAIALLGLAFAVNWTYHVIRKPAELFFPLSGVLAKTPAETWRQYEPIFREHATQTITAEFLAALAQVEGAGNPVAKTYWRWRLSSDPLDIYRPASSAVGMYQITDATFIDAKRYCIRDHSVVQDGPWHDPSSCWFNALYLRVVPSHAVEMTSAFLDRRTSETLRQQGLLAATREQKQDLAALIHLCGASAGAAYARRGFTLSPGQRCGEHDPQRYLDRVNAMKRLFARMAGGTTLPR
jgi:hypothetical protein